MRSSISSSIVSESGHRRPEYVQRHRFSGIDEVEARVDTARPGEIERAVNEIVDDLNALESPINGFFDDVEELKAHNHPEANDFYRQYVQ